MTNNPNVQLARADWEKLLDFMLSPDATLDEIRSRGSSLREKYGDEVFEQAVSSAAHAEPMSQ